jgi:dolichyl-phosphate-mannose--protein O-mannosyl transferase
MGDSDIATYFSVLALVITIASVVVAVIAWRIKNKPFRIGVGISLLIIAGSFVLLSFFASFLIGGLGLVILLLGRRT